MASSVAQPLIIKELSAARRTRLAAASFVYNYEADGELMWFVWSIELVGGSLCSRPGGWCGRTSPLDLPSMTAAGIVLPF